jgi:hypothetical protein
LSVEAVQETVTEESVRRDWDRLVGTDGGVVSWEPPELVFIARAEL